VYGVALVDAGRAREALAVTERALARHPDDRALTELWLQLRPGARRP